MKPTRSSGNLIELTRVSSSLSSSRTSLINVTFPPLSLAAGANRKRRRAPTHLARINLTATSLSNLTSTSSESLNGGGGNTASTTPNIGNNDDNNKCLTPTLLSSYDEQPPFVSSLNGGDEYDKRSRFCPANNGSLSAGIRLNSLPLTQENIQGKSIESTATSANNNLVDDCYDLAELESAQSVSAGSTSIKPFGGLRIGDGAFELVGDGRECKAVNTRTQAVYHCQILKCDEYKAFVNVANRLQSAKLQYEENDFDEMKNLLIPDSTEAIHGENDTWYILSPDHFGNLHTLIHANLPSTTDNLSASSASSLASGGVLDEQRIQPIFKQIVALVHFCHEIGIYFRDFRLRKFVFVDRNKTQIRINSVLDLCVAAEINDDQMTERHVCPAYVAPEILDVRSNAYAGRPADIWALGVLMFILLTNHYPFYDHNHAALFRRIRTRRLSFPVSEKISPDARWLLHALLRLDPIDRPSAAEILNTHWLKAASLSSENVEQFVQASSADFGHNVANSENNSLLYASSLNIANINNHNLFNLNDRLGLSSGSRVLLERSNSSQPPRQLQQLRQSTPQLGLRPNRTLTSLTDVAAVITQRNAIPTQNRNQILIVQKRQQQQVYNNAELPADNTVETTLSQQQPSLNTSSAIAELGSPTFVHPVIRMTAECNDLRLTIQRKPKQLHDYFDQTVPNNDAFTHEKNKPKLEEHCNAAQQQAQMERRQRLSLNIGRARQLHTAPNGIAISPTSTQATLSPSATGKPAFSTASSPSSSVNILASAR